MPADEWYCAKDGQPVGPMSLSELIQQLPAAGGPNAQVYGPGFSDWVPARSVPKITATDSILGAN